MDPVSCFLRTAHYFAAARLRRAHACALGFSMSALNAALAMELLKLEAMPG